jgi:hypothetical protein
MYAPLSVFQNQPQKHLLHCPYSSDHPFGHRCSFCRTVRGDVTASAADQRKELLPAQRETRTNSAEVMHWLEQLSEAKEGKEAAGSFALLGDDVPSAPPGSTEVGGCPAQASAYDQELRALKSELNYLRCKLNTSSHPTAPHGTRLSGPMRARHEDLRRAVLGQIPDATAPTPPAASHSPWDEVFATIIDGEEVADEDDDHEDRGEQKCDAAEVDEALPELISDEDAARRLHKERKEGRLRRLVREVLRAELQARDAKMDRRYAKLGVHVKAIAQDFKVGGCGVCLCG